MRVKHGMPALLPSVFPTLPTDMTSGRCQLSNLALGFAAFLPAAVSPCDLLPAQVAKKDLIQLLSGDVNGNKSPVRSFCRGWKFCSVTDPKPESRMSPSIDSSE